MTCGVFRTKIRYHTKITDFQRPQNVELSYDLHFNIFKGYGCHIADFHSCQITSDLIQQTLMNTYDVINSRQTRLS